MIDSFPFLRYCQEEEKEDGAYRKILEIPEDKLDDIYYCYLTDLIPSINDLSLKNLLKEKVYNKLLNVGIVFFRYSDSLNMNIFNEDEKRKLILKEIKTFNRQINENEKNNNYLILSSIRGLCSLLTNFNNEFSKEYLNAIFASINSCENIKDKELLNYNLLKMIDRVLPLIHEDMLSNFPYKLPETYLKRLEIDSNPNYTKDNEKLFENERIGIDEKISIGLEVEVNNNINNDFYISSQASYESYITDNDATVPFGLEFKPPVFHDGKGIKKIASFFKTIQDIGFYYDQENHNCGGQINLGLSYLDSKESVLNFYQIYCNCEELLFYISNEEGQLSRQEIYRNSRFKPISELIGKRVIRDTVTREEVLNALFVNRSDNELGLLYKKNTACIRDLNDKDKARLEFRIPNGSASFKVWKDNIRLYGKMFEVAKKLENISKKDYLTEREEEQMQSFVSLLYDTSLEEKEYNLMNLLFEDENLKEIYNRRYEATVREIKRTETDLYEYKFKQKIYNEPAFSSVEFFTGDEEDRLKAYYDPETETVRNVNEDIEVFEEYNDKHTFKNK